MKRKTGIGLVLGILLIGMVSAAFLPYFGKITGDVSVSAPVFYASAEHLVNNNDTSYWGLGIDNYITRSSPISFTGGSNKWFVSAPLGVDHFYAADYKMTIEASSDNESGQIRAELWYVNGTTGIQIPNEQVCDVFVPVYTLDNYTIDCSSPVMTGLNPSWRLAWILSDGSNSIHYNIYLDGNTKIEVIPQ